MTTLTKERAFDMVQVEELCRRSFIDFLDFVRIRSDDPLAPVVSAWQPWDYLLDQARSWASGTSEIDLKARQIGYSWLVAAYAVWRARSPAGAMVALISKGQLESRELAAKCAFVEAHLPDWLRVGATVRVDDIAFPGGGKIMAFPSTPDAGVGFTFQVVIMDEAHFHPYAAQNYAAIRPTLSAGGQFIALSTADPSLGPNGWFPQMYWASKAGETGYEARFIGWATRPGRDAAWLRRERAAYQGLPEEFDAYYPDSDAAAFVARSGLVFPQFSAVRHVREAVTPLRECVRVVAGVDFGGGDPTAVVVLGLDKQHHVHQYAEFYKRGAVGVDEIVGFLARIPGLGVAVCDPSQAVAIETMRRQGINARPANNKRGEGLGMVAFLLDNDRLTIDPSCTESIAEFPGYRWANKTDPNDRTKYATSTPVDHHSDAGDARRYAVLEITAMLHETVGPLVRTFTGRRPARSAA